MGDYDYKLSEKPMSETPFIPSEIANMIINKMQEDMVAMRQKHLRIVEAIDQSYKTIEEENERHVIEFFNALKNKTTEKFLTLKALYLAVVKEKEDLQSKTQAVITVIL